MDSTVKMKPLHVLSQGLWPLGEVDSILDVDSDFEYLFYFVMGDDTFLNETIHNIRSTFELPPSATFCNDFFQNSTSLTQDKELKVTNEVSLLISQHFDEADPSSTTIKKNKEWTETVQSLFIIDNVQRFTMENIRELNFVFRMGTADCPQCSRKAALVFLFHSDPPPLTSELAPYDENEDGNIDYGELRTFLSKKFYHSDVQFNGEAFIGRMHNMAIQRFDSVDTHNALNNSVRERISSSICSQFVVPSPQRVLKHVPWLSVAVAVLLVLLPFAVMKMWPRKAPSDSVKCSQVEIQPILEISELSSKGLQHKDDSEPKPAEMKEKECTGDEGGSCMEKEEESYLKSVEKIEEQDGVDTAESQIEQEQCVARSEEENPSHDSLPEETQHLNEKANETKKEAIPPLPGSHEKKRRGKAEVSEVPSHHYNLRSRRSP